MDKNLLSKPIDTAYRNIRQILEDARKIVYSTVNVAMVQAYWNIGRLIFEEEQRGKAKMRLFYLSFEIPNAERSLFLPDKIHHALRDELPVIRPELSSTHYRLLLKVERTAVCKFYLEREFAAKQRETMSPSKSEANK